MEEIVLLFSPGFSEAAKFQDATEKYFGKVRLVVLLVHVNKGIQKGVRSSNVEVKFKLNVIHCTAETLFVVMIFYV